MPYEVEGVVALKQGDPVSLETIVVPDPAPGEAVVRVQACGVCHTDIHLRDGGIPTAYPVLLGHEAAGVVEAVGEGVTDVAPGDYVVLNWLAVCHECRNCRRGRPWSCTATKNATQTMTLLDGTPLSTAMGIGAFTPMTLVAAGQCTKVDPRIRPQTAGLIGCGVMTGVGAVLNTAKAQRGDSVAVIGCGGVGDGAIAAAALAGATTIVAVDTDDRKLEWARGFGATHTVNARQENPVDAIRAVTDGLGADVVIDAVGRPETWEQAFWARDVGGTLVLVGIPGPELSAPDIPLVEYFRRGGSLTASRYGQCLPSRDFPLLAELHLNGRLPLDGFVSAEFALGEAEMAFATLQAGEVVRSVVVP